MKMSKWLQTKMVMVALLLSGVCFGLLDPVTAAAMGMVLSVDSTAILGNDAILYVSVGSPTNFLAIANAKNIQFDNGTSTKVEVTHLRSPAKEFRAGKSDPGSLTFEVDTDMSDPGQAALAAARSAGTVCEFKITMASGSTPNWTARGTVAKFDKMVNTDTPFKSSVEAYITGPWTNS